MIAAQTPHQVVIVARNLVGASGDGVMVDDIVVDFTPCDNGPRNSPGATPCDVQCNFESGALVRVSKQQTKIHCAGSLCAFRDSQAVTGEAKAQG